MEIQEIIEDILLNLLIFNVENRNRWMGVEILKLKIKCSDDEFENAMEFLKKEELVEFKNEDYLKITDNGIKYIIQKV